MTRYRGDTQIMSWTLKINGTATDLTTATTVTYTYFKKEDEINIVGTVTDASHGIVEFSVLDTDFDLVGTFTFDIQVVYDDGTKRTFIKDDLIIVDDINKA